MWDAPCCCGAELASDVDLGSFLGWTGLPCWLAALPMLWPPQRALRCERLLLCGWCGVGFHACCPTLVRALSDVQHWSCQMCTTGVSDCLPGPCARAEAHSAHVCNLVQTFYQG